MKSAAKPLLHAKGPLLPTAQDWREIRYSSEFAGEAALTLVTALLLALRERGALSDGELRDVVAEAAGHSSHGAAALIGRIGTKLRGLGRRIGLLSAGLLHAGATIPIVVSRSVPETAMTQTSNRFLDEVARLMNDAAGVATGVRREFDTLMRAQAERILRDLDVVQREEFDAVKEMARIAREENEALKAQLEALKARVAALEGRPLRPDAPGTIPPGGTPPVM